jgi:formate dehydrogenase iron-sulfur subunit
VQTCPTDALEYGDRDELLKKAHERIAAHPDKYVQHVYGEHENGGTSYLIISHVPFKDLGLPELPEEPINEVSEKVMEMTIPFALGWGAVLTAVTVGVAAYDKKKNGNAAEKKAEESK